MVLGFISLLLTFGQTYISKICIPDKVADTMLPCPAKHLAKVADGGGHHAPGEGHHKPPNTGDHNRRLLFEHGRILAADSAGACKPVSIFLDLLVQCHSCCLYVLVFTLTCCSWDCVFYMTNLTSLALEPRFAIYILILKYTRQGFRTFFFFFFCLDSLNQKFTG